MPNRQSDRRPPRRRRSPGRRPAFHAWMAAFLVPWLTIGPAWAQSRLSSLDDLLRSVDGERTGEAQIGAGYRDVQWSLEAPIDRDLYRLIPGDRIAVGIWGETPITHLLGVTPDGMLVVPKVGPIEVLTHTVNEAEAEVARALSGHYPGTRITVTLLEPGRFRVSVTGMVASPGVYESSAGDRISMALRAAGGVSPGGSIRRVRIADPQASKDTASRSATSSAGPSREIDLLPWLVSGDLASNPTLISGQVVEVPTQEETVAMRGAINGRSSLRNPAPLEGAYGNRPAEDPEFEVEWREGDTVGSLLAAAGGPSRAATGTAFLNRGEVEPRRLDLARAEDLAFPLEPGDQIDIETSARWVYVVGSVRQPGRYPYIPGYSAEEYVLMAGGTTELGRKTKWEITRLDGEMREIEGGGRIEPGTKLHVPETRVQSFSRYLGPLTSAAAFALTVVAISRR